MEVSTTQHKRCEVISPSGKIDSYYAPKLGEVFDQITEAGQHNIVLDLKDVQFMSSAGLRVLINNQKICKRYNRGEVLLAEVPGQIYSALELAGFIPLFRIFDNLTDAVGSF